MIEAFKFLTHLTKDGYLTIPPEYATQLPQTSTFQVILVMNEQILDVLGATLVEDKDTKSSSALERLIAKIQRTPSPLSNFVYGNGFLAEHLANPVTESDLAFDLEMWKVQWNQIESKLKAADLVAAQRKHEDFIS